MIKRLIRKPIKIIFCVLQRKRLRLLFLFFEREFMRGNKYGNRKITIDNITFDSTGEGLRYKELKLLEKTGQITDLQLQKRFVVVPEIRENDTVGPRGGVKKGKVIQKAVYYIADFVYYDKNGQQVVEDYKGYRTDVYKLKKKLMKYIYDIDIKET